MQHIIIMTGLIFFAVGLLTAGFIAFVCDEDVVPAILLLGIALLVLCVLLGMVSEINL